MFVSKLKADGSQLLYSAIFGGNTNGVGKIAVNSNNEAAVAGFATDSFPATSGPQVVFGRVPQGPYQAPYVANAFVAKLNSAGTDLLVSSYLGGYSARANSVAIDNAGAVYLAGAADGTFPVTDGTFQTVRAGGVFVSKIVDPSTCTYTVQQGASSLVANVTTQSGCNWIAVSGASWIGVASGRSGSGNGTIRLLVDANAGMSRTGTVSIAGQQFAVSQTGGCQLVLSSNSQTFGADAGTGWFNGFISSGCSIPSASTNDSWIHLPVVPFPPYQASYQYSIDANTSGQARTGTIKVGSQTFTISQSATACTFAVSANSVTLQPNLFDSVQIALSANYDTCSWVVTSTNSFVRVTPSEGQGSATLSFSKEDFYSGPSRIGSATVAGNAISVTDPAQGTEFKIINKMSGKALDVTGYSLLNGTAIQQWDYLDGDNQKWYVIPQDSQNYKIINKMSGKALDVTGYSLNNGTPIQQWDFLSGGNQLWQLSLPNFLDFKIMNKMSGKVLDVTGYSTSNGGRIQQWDFLNGNNQLWQLVPVD